MDENRSNRRPGANNSSIGAAYAASKHGLVGLTRNTAAYYATRGIRCVCIMPVGMHTNIVESVQGQPFHEQGVKLAASSLGDFPWNPLEEVAKTCLCLCSDGMDTINGALVNTDDGLTCI